MSLRIVGAAACGAVLTFSACSQKRTEVVIGVATDLAAPGSLDQVTMDVLRDGVPLFGGDIASWRIDPTQEKYNLPGSFGVYTDDGSEPRIEVQVHGLVAGTEIVTRRSIFALVKERTLFLRMALVEACSNANPCPQPLTCVEGRCKAALLDAHLFPDYSQNAEQQVKCTSGTNFINTRTGETIKPVGQCQADEDCVEGTCYKKATVPGDGGIPNSPGWSLLSFVGPPARRFESASQAASDGSRLLVWGGLDAASQPVRDTWSFDGASWTQLASDIGGAADDPTGPTVFDAAHNVFVTYREPSGDLVVFDGTTWTKLAHGSDPGSPSPRQHSRLAYDSAHGKTLLFGGTCLATTTICTDTWLWDGTVWQSVVGAGPPGRRDAGLAFAPGLGKAILFGGRNVTTLHDTWGFDGSSWSQVASDFPNPVIFDVGGLMVWDDDANRLLWLNGPREVYRLDGSSWTQLLVDPNAPLLGTFSGAYLKRIKAVVAFGGSDSHGAPLAQTWVLNVP
jgi:hypothetical protein